VNSQKKKEKKEEALINQIYFDGMSKNVYKEYAASKLEPHKLAPFKQLRKSAIN
jgi:hypothetical protein